jgi:hypothetical protein
MMFSSAPRKCAVKGVHTSVEAISISAGAADAFVALALKEVDLFEKRFRTAFVLGAERAEWFEFRDQWVGRPFGIVQVVLRVLSILDAARI